MRNTKAFVLGMVVVPLAVIGVVTVYGSTVTVPNTFVSGTPAVAAEVNANFTALAAAVNDNDSRVSANEGRIMSLPLLHASARTQEDWTIPSPGKLIAVFPLTPTNDELAGKSYTFECSVFVTDDQSAVLQTPTIQGDVNFELVFNRSAQGTPTPADAPRGFVVALDGVPSIKSASFTDTWPAAGTGLLAKQLGARVELYVSGTTAEIAGTHLFITRCDLKVSP